MIDAEKVAALLHNLRNRELLTPGELETILRYMEQREKVLKQYYALTRLLNRHINPLIEDLQQEGLVGEVVVKRLLPERYCYDDEPYDEWLYDLDIEDEEDDSESERDSKETARQIAQDEARATHLARIDALLPAVTSLEDIDELYKVHGYADGHGHAIHRYLRRRVEALEKLLAAQKGKG